MVFPDSRHKDSWTRLVSALLVLAPALVGCGGPDASPATCTPPMGTTGSPSSISDAVTLANALFSDERPEVTLSCFVETLDRPLATLAANSFFSAQPALGRRSPRIFLFTGSLVMSVAPGGSGSHLLELAEYSALTRSIKAEILFPLRKPLLPAQPYDRVRFLEGTSCGVCHGSEVPAPSVTIAQAFESDVLRPRLQEEVSLDYLQAEALACDRDREPQRCETLRAVFGHGDVYPARFPTEAKTIYGN